MLTDALLRGCRVGQAGYPVKEALTSEVVAKIEAPNERWIEHSGSHPFAVEPWSR